jgi:glycosyltransferase involved in cell wall biosynthesis
MACGKAIIAHNSGGTPEVVDQAGYLLGDKEEDWRTQFDELMESEALRKDLGRKAYERSKQFTWERAAESLEEALGTLV